MQYALVRLERVLIIRSSGQEKAWRPVVARDARMCSMCGHTIAKRSTVIQPYDQTDKDRLCLLCVDLLRRLRLMSFVKCPSCEELIPWRPLASHEYACHNCHGIVDATGELISGELAVEHCPLCAHTVWYRESAPRRMCDHCYSVFDVTMTECEDLDMNAQNFDMTQRRNARKVSPLHPWRSYGTSFAVEQESEIT